MSDSTGTKRTAVEAAHSANVCSRRCDRAKIYLHFTLFLHGVRKEKFIKVLGNSVLATYRQHYKHWEWNNDDNNNNEQGDNIAVYGISSKTSLNSLEPGEINYMCELLW